MKTKHWRQMTPEENAQRLRDGQKAYNARVWLCSNVRRGKIKRLPCEICGAEPAEGHHDDYDKPLEVRWLCFRHHRELHKAMRNGVAQ